MSGPVAGSDVGGSDDTTDGVPVGVDDAGEGFVFSEKPLELVGGDGVHLEDADGKQYLDFGASYACTPIGHGHPAVTQAVREQAERMVYVQASYPTPTRTTTYEKLGAVAPGDINKVWLCNSGTEAVEAAMKFARSATDRKKVVAAKNAFHGRTMGALSLTWKPKYRKQFDPIPRGVQFVPYGDSEALADAVDEDTAAVFLEPIQGEGGIYPASASYLQTAREATREAGAALVCDEIQTGLGRTGELWACERAGIVPDAVTTAKGVASGLPLGATLCADWLAEGAGNHGSTFSGNPIPCAAANATLDTIVGDDLPTHAAEVGSYLRAEIEAAAETHDLPIREVRGAGLMLGVQLRRGANRVLRELALSESVLALPAGRTVLRLLPPLTVTEADADRLVTALTEVLS